MQRIQCYGDVLLGFERLSIMGLTEKGMQPFELGSNSIICNGEIYGFRKIKAALEKEYDFESDSDCEILLPLYEKYGTAMFGMLDAEYACVLYDGDRDELIAGAWLRLTPDDPAAIHARMMELWAKRSASQPLEKPSAGSTFKRPATGYAAAMIEQAGLKGFSVGGAQVSEKHAGFVINTGSATFADVTALMAHIQETVYERFGVRLEPEVRII